MYTIAFDQIFFGIFFVLTQRKGIINISEINRRFSFQEKLFLMVSNNDVGQRGTKR